MSKTDDGKSVENGGSEPLFAVIIPHRNDEKRLEKCLTALLHHQENAPPTSDFEILVVDNGSDADVAPLIDRYPPARLVLEPKPGAAHARNKGVASSRAERLFFLDCDCIPAPDWLERACKAVENRDIVGGRVDTLDETPPPRTGAEAFEVIFAFHQRRYIEKEGFSVTANLLTWRRIFDDVGPFRDGLSEDLDWCRRATDQGYNIVYDDALRVQHPTRSDWAALKRKWLRLVREAYAQNEADGGSRLYWLLRGVAVSISPLVHIRRILMSNDVVAPGERWRAVVTLFRIRLFRSWWMIKQALGFRP